MRAKLAIVGRRGQRCVVRVVEERTGLALNDRFERAAGAQRDRGRSGGGRFQRNEPEIFLAG